jgi:hypothetical protein
MGHYLSDMLPDAVGKCPTCGKYVFDKNPKKHLDTLRAWMKSGLMMYRYCKCHNSVKPLGESL